MCYLAQVNIGITPVPNTGLFQIVFGLFYFIFSIIQIMQNRNRVNSLTLAFYLIQLVIVPIFLFISGLILLYQGWRLDPILQFQQFILFLLIVFLILKEIIINTVNRNR